MKWFINTITEEMRSSIIELSDVCDRYHFYLAGGTAVALQLGHRQSVDLDFFSASDQWTSEDIKTIFSSNFNYRFVSESAGTLHCIVKNVRVSFLRFPYRMLNDPTPFEGYRIQVASISDLAAMKLSAIAQRGAKKDFIDLFAIGLSGLTLDEMIRAYQRKFDVKDVGYVIASLTYFADADDDVMPTMLTPMSWEKVKSTVQSWIRSSFYK